MIVADGRGTPGRDCEWEKAINGNLLRPAAEDQIVVLRDAMKRYSFLDGSRVAIRGWSFGGYLAIGTAVLYPKLIRAVSAGAPVTDWRLYDTHYSERYLGIPSKRTADNYQKSSLLNHCEHLSAEMLIVHGFADDNVHISHSLMLFQRLLSLGKPYTFLPLGGVSHTPEAKITPLILSAELLFLQRAMR